MTFRLKAGIIFSVIVVVAVTSAFRYFTAHRDALAISARVLDKVPDFTLLDHNGSIRNLHSYAKSKTVILSGYSNLCASASGVLRAMPETLKSLRARNVQLLFISTDSAAERIKMIDATFVAQTDVSILLDTSGIVSKTLSFTGFGDTVVIEPPQWKVKYRGDLPGALKAAGLNGGMGELQACTLPSLQFTNVSYAREVAPLIAEKCLNCHSPGRKFRPVLNSYEKVRNWSAMIRETLLTDRMPPFSADPLYGKYSNDISLSAEQKRLLVDWIDGGMPKDDGEDPLPAFERESGQLKVKIRHPRKPLYSVTMDKPAEIPPGGNNEYRFFQMGGPAPFDMWVSAVFTETTNPRQLHHEALLITKYPLTHFKQMAEPQRDEELVRKDKDGIIPLYIPRTIGFSSYGNDPHYVRFQNWSAGKIQPTRFGAENVVYIPKGYFLILEVHYMGTGKVETEQTSLKFFGERTPRGGRTVHNINLVESGLKIPPGERSYKASSQPRKIEQNIALVSLLAHLHMRGRAIKLVSTDSHGNNKTLASMPNFYYGWSTGAGLRPSEPIAVDKGSTLHIDCEFDNSAENPNNPDPLKTIRFGQRVDRAEMCAMGILFVNR